uniref:Ovochymase-2 n=1 Tax=Leptobrachium leishanense TaxID=445787 RepID=A0A8C5M9H6_9ANUR
MWEITVPEDKVVHLWFEEFHVVTSAQCVEDHVTVEDDIGNIGSFCGHTVPKAMVSVGNKMIISFISKSKTTDKGFQAKYEAIDPSKTADIMGGGGHLQSQEGEFSTPLSARSGYMNNALYQWRLTVASGQRIMLTFTSFDLEPEGPAGCKDVVEVFDGNSNSAQKIGHFCGKEIPGPLYASGNNLMVRFKSDNEGTGMGFSAKYSAFSGQIPPTQSPTTVPPPEYIESGCDSSAVQTDRKGVLHSKNFPDSYPANLICTWNITIPEGFLIKLTFTHLAIDGETGICAGDKLDVSDNTGLIGSYCGYLAPPVIISSNNKLFLQFSTDSRRSDMGFEVTWEQVYPDDIEEIQTCGGYSNEESGLITSPNWPSAYAANTLCMWRIEVQTGKRLTLKFTDFELEDPTLLGSCYDYLAIYEEYSGGVNERGTFCGSTIPNTLISQDNVLVLRFFSDLFSQAKGFRIFWTTNALEAPPTIPPPPPNPWDDIPIEWPSRCGTPSRPPSITSRIVNGEQAVPHTWPWQVSMQVWPASRNETIFFHTCGGTLIHKNWVLTAAHCFINYADELFRWRMCLGKHNLTIVEPSEQCYEILGIYLHEQFLYPNIPVEYDIALVKLNGDVEASDEIDFACLPPAGQVLSQSYRCHATGWGDETGNSLAPKAAEALNQVPLPVIPFEVCRTPQYWWFQVRDSMICAGYILPDELKSVCQGDSGGPLACPSLTNSSIWEVHGITSFGVIGCIMDKKPSVFTRTSAYIDWIHQTMKKYLFDHNVSRCGGAKDLYDGKGTFTSMKFPSTYNNDASCSWNIIAPEDKVVHLHFDNFLIEDSNGCLNDKVVISDELGSLGTHCGGNVPADIVSYSNALSVDFTSNSRVVDTGFSVTWEFVDAAAIPGIAKCGGNYNSETGEFTSPNWPNSTYPINHVCTWKITVAADKQLQIAFTDFALQPAVIGACPDYVEIFDGDKSGAPILGRFCGFSTPSPLKTTGNTAVIKFITNHDIVYRGFHGHWTTNLTNTIDLPISPAKPWSEISVDWPAACATTVNPSSEAEESETPVLLQSKSHLSVQSRSKPYLQFQHRCMGTLINSQWILLAAHCIDISQKAENMRVCSGSTPSERCFGTDAVIRHEGFVYGQSEDHSHDIALLHISKPMSGLKPLCLPGGEQLLPSREQCYWAGSSAGTDLLIPMSIIQYQTCSQPKFWWSQVSPSMICAESESSETLKSTCINDAEGALICKADTTWEVHGVASFGSPNCVVDRKPPVFTKVSVYKGWIVENIKKFTYENSLEKKA